MSASFPIAFGRYHLVELLAVGGMAELFLAEVKGDHGFAKKVVIKRILPHLAADAHFTQMFIAEANITARLAHPRIAQTHRLGREGNQLYIEMEYIDGLDVLAILRECAHRRVRLPPEVSAYLIKEVLDGLDYAHKLADDGGKLLGIVHRDVSPSNILISRKGNVKLVDFGIAHATGFDQQTQAGTLKGKYGYMSPEQVLGEGVTSQSDIFSVGVVFAELLMGRRLFAAPNELDVLLMVRDVNLGRLERYGKSIPPGLDALMRRAMRKARSERFASAAEFRDALDEWLFENRHRVTPVIVGHLVEDLYEDAHQRRRAGMEEGAGAPADDAAGSPLAAALAGEAALPVAVTEPGRASPQAGGGTGTGTGSGSRKLPLPPPSAPTRRKTTPPAVATPPLAARSPSAVTRPPSELEGIPLGTSQLGEPGIEQENLSEEEIELAFGALRDGLSLPGNESMPELAATGTGAGFASPAGAPGAGRAGGDEDRRTVRMPTLDRPPAAGRVSTSGVSDEELSLSEEIVVDLEGLDGGPSARAGTADEVDLTEESSMPRGAVTDDDGIPISVEDPEHSMRFPTISAAVASVSPPSRDPSSRDFDDSDVSGVVEPEKDVRSRKLRLPSPAEIARSPKPKPPSLDEISDTPAQQGDLGKMSPIRLLFQLVSSRADGLLVVSVGGVRKEIFIKDGVPTYVSSNMAGELFGAYLVQEGAVSSGELDMALAMMPHFGGKLGDTLVGLGLMKPLDVFRLLTRQVRAKLIDVCTWDRGTYTWFPWRENHRESFPLDLDPYEVLGAGAMALPDESVWRWSESAAEVKPRATERAGLRPEQFKAGRQVREVLEACRGERSVNDFVVHGIDAMDRVQMLRVLFLVLETGMAVDAAG